MRSFSLMFAAAIGAFVGWLITEPMAPAMGNTIAWSQFELKLGFIISALIGLGLGIVTGIYQGSAKHTIIGGVAGIVIGGIGGVAGILVGNQIFGSFIAFEFLARIAGWCAFGAFIGTSVGAVGFSVKRLKVGLIGGAIGGAIGGFLFQTVGAQLTMVKVLAEGANNDTGSLARAIGFTTLAACIGLMVGIVEVISRSAWVKLVLGKNEGREWLVDDAGTLVGSDELSHIPLRGVGIAPKHAMIHKHQGNYFISDLGSGLPTIVNGQPVTQAMLIGGETLQLGQYSLQFLTKNQATQPANQHQVAPVQPVMQINMGVQDSPSPAVAPAQNLAQTQVIQSAVQSGVAAAWILVAMNGPQAGQKFQILQNSEVGRESNVIPLSHDTACSRKHAQLTPHPNGLEITDLRSTNGIYVNQQRVQSAITKFGDIVTFGGSTFRIEQ